MDEVGSMVVNSHALLNMYTLVVCTIYRQPPPPQGYDYMDGPCMHISSIAEMKIRQVREGLIATFLLLPFTCIHCSFSHYQHTSLNDLFTQLPHILITQTCCN